ncbi:hypothetical protein D3C73_1583600 [compost metagenome]
MTTGSSNSLIVMDRSAVKESCTSPKLKVSLPSRTATFCSKVCCCPAFNVIASPIGAFSRKTEFILE